MTLCGVCNTEIHENEGHRISATEFRQIVVNGFNPFTEHIPISGEVSEQSKDTQYQQWQAHVLASNTDKVLCNRCYDIAKRYSAKHITEGAEIVDVHATYQRVQRTVEAPSSKMSKFRALKLEISITIVLLIVFGLYLMGNREVFTQFDIYYAFMSTIPFCGIMALSITLVVTLGEMDLSFPSVLAFSALLFGKVFESLVNKWPEHPWDCGGSLFCCGYFGRVAQCFVDCADRDSVTGRNHWDPVFFPRFGLCNCSRKRSALGESPRDGLLQVNGGPHFVREV